MNSETIDLRKKECYIDFPPISLRNKGWVRSSAVEHYLDMVGVTGSIPVAPTNLFNELEI